nr:MAG TPA: hypothetical protein [Caudoviricetes sp.]
MPAVIDGGRFYICPPHDIRRSGFVAFRQFCSNVSPHINISGFIPQNCCAIDTHILGNLLQCQSSGFPQSPKSFPYFHIFHPLWCFSQVQYIMLCQKNNTQHATILTKDIDNYNNKVYFYNCGCELRTTHQRNGKIANCTTKKGDTKMKK